MSQMDGVERAFQGPETGCAKYQKNTVGGCTQFEAFRLAEVGTMLRQKVGN